MFPYISNIKGYIRHKITDLILEREYWLDDILGREESIPRIRLNNSLLNKIFDHENALKTILNNEVLMKKFLMDVQFRNKLRFLDIQDRASKLKYALPTFLVSFPRSGSNFLQSVLQSSSGFVCQSIYAPLREPSAVTLSVKSHATSLEYLMDEIYRFIPEIARPSKVLLLQRDPRDVMISFYEYVKVMRGLEISQSEFLDKCSFFYAATIDKEFKRRVDTGPLNIRDAYRKHVDNWFMKVPNDLDCLVVKYEDLVISPDAEFKRIFEFLELDCPILSAALRVKVSLYSNDGRQRGRAGGWQDNKTQYSTLLEYVHRYFLSEIRYLGYEG